MRIVLCLLVFDFGLACAVAAMLYLICLSDTTGFLKVDMIEITELVDSPWAVRRKLVVKYSLVKQVFCLDIFRIFRFFGFIRFALVLPLFRSGR